MDDQGIAALEGIVRGCLKRYITLRIMRGDPAPVVEVPLVVNIPLADREEGNVPGIKFSGQLAGAIHEVIPISGVISL
jgi:hypothetical protein